MDGRRTVREEMARILKPADPLPPKATATHEALLTLGRCREGPVRVITTNFDRLFEEVIDRGASPVGRFQAPLLPVPKNRWDGLVYLHGLLPPDPSPSDLDKLVLSSGDFGLAYLTERWAARFVSELLRNYTLCFVGYGINDPVLRYMMDALAAKRSVSNSKRNSAPSSPTNSRPCRRRSPKARLSRLCSRTSTPSQSRRPFGGLSRFSPEEESRLDFLERSLLDLKANDPEKLARELDLRARRVQTLGRQGVDPELTEELLRLLMHLEELITLPSHLLASPSFQLGLLRQDLDELVGHFLILSREARVVAVQLVDGGG